MIRRVALALLLAGLARVALAEDSTPVAASAGYSFYPSMFASVSRTNTGAWRSSLGLPSLILDVQITIGGGKSASLYVSTSGTQTGQPSNATHGTTLTTDSGIEAITQTGRYVIRGLSAWTKIRIEATNGATVTVGAVFVGTDISITRTWTGIAGTITASLSNTWTGAQIDGVSAGVTFQLGAGTAAVGTVAMTPGTTVYTQPAPATLTVTATGAADAAITLSIPSASGLFHYITSIEIVKYVTAAITASATPVIITTTNLNSRDFNMRRYGAVADAEVLLLEPAFPIRSAAVTTASTIVCPAVTGVKWVVTVHYYTGP